MKIPNIPNRIGVLISRYPIVIVVAAAVCAALSVWAASGVTLKTEIKDMLSEENLQARSYTAIIDSFETMSVLLVTVEGKDRHDLIEAATVFAERLERDERLKGLVKTVNLKPEEGFLEKWGMLLMDSKALKDNIPVFMTPGLTPMVRALNDRLESGLSDGSADEDVDSRSDEEDFVSFLDRLDAFATEMGDYLVSGADPAASGEVLSRELLYGQPYMVNPEGTMLIFSVTPAFGLMDRKKLIELTDIVRGYEKEMSAAFPGLKFGSAGDIASEADEERAISSDITYPSIIAMALILVLFVFSYGRFRSVVFALIALTLGILFDVGLSALVIGEFNMITSAFGALLVGLGIDFGVHYITRVDIERRRFGGEREALVRTIEKTLLPVSIGAVTTSLAFYVLLLSESKAFRQFGFVAGTGIITTLVAMYTILPALLVLFPGRQTGVSEGDPATGKSGNPRRSRRLWRFGFLSSLGAAVENHPVPFAVVGSILTVAAAFCIPLNAFEYDMRKIGPKNTESRQTENRIIEKFDLSAYPSMAMVNDFDEARVLTDTLQDHPMIRRVESPTLFVPPLSEQEERLELLHGFRQALEEKPSSGNDGIDPASLAGEIQRLEWNVLELADLSVASLGEDNFIQRKRVSMIREPGEGGKPGREVFAKLKAVLESGEPAVPSRLASIDAAFTEAMRRNLLVSLSVRDPITVSDIPEDQRASMVTPDYSGFLITIYPDSGVSEEKALLAFHKEMIGVHPKITGGLQIIIEFSREMLSEARKMLLYVAAVVVLLLFITVRSVKDNVTALIGLLMTLVVMLGIYPFWGRFNMINVLAIPLIVGMGIDYGVHILHAYRTGTGGLAVALQESGKAVFLSASTTIIGFGSLVLIGSFQGIAALGKVLTVGISASLVFSLTFVPAVAVLLSRSKIKSDSKRA